MPDFLKTAFATHTDVSPLNTLLRLLVALVLGVTVSWIYRRARGSAAANGSFPGTLVLLAVLIAIVTQVIGDNVARAFSLVGALSIVRFRTVVRDTQDTAYVIFAVVIGMAVGALNLWVAGIGLVVVGIATWLIRLMGAPTDESLPAYLLNLRIGVGHDREALLGGILDAHLQSRDLVSVETARQGIALEVVFETRLRPNASPEELVKALNRVEGVQGVSLKRRGFEPI